MSFQTLTIRIFPIILFFMATNPWQKTFAQRMVIASENGTTNSPTSSSSSDQSQILKTYPDGTKKIVPLAALNFHDDGKAFGGSPQLSVYSDPATPIIPPSSERLSVAPIGTPVTPTTMNNSLPSSPDPLAGTTSTTAAGDPMGGGPTANPMGGGSAPVDPLSGSFPKGSPPPLQTVSGKPAPVSSAETTVELGTYEDFFMNAAIGGAIQGQLTARRVYNGTNMQAYPFGPEPNASFPYNQSGVASENFTFNPGFRFDVEFGYNFYDWLGISLQTGIIYNGLNQYNLELLDSVEINGQTLGPGSYHCSADGDLVQVPVQLDAILRWPGTMAFKPFIGGGIGAIWQQLDVNNYYFGANDVQGNYCRSAFQFGFNGQVGANYTVTPGVDFYGVFKLLGAFTPRIGNYDFENSYNFALEVGVQSRF